MQKKKISLLLACVLTVSALFTGCGSGQDSASGGITEAAGGEAAQETESKEPITLTFFDKNTGDAFEDPVAQEIMAKTGVKIEVQQPTGNPED